MSVREILITQCLKRHLTHQVSFGTGLFYQPGNWTTGYFIVLVTLFSCNLSSNGKKKDNNLDIFKTFFNVFNLMVYIRTHPLTHNSDLFF